MSQSISSLYIYTFSLWANLLLSPVVGYEISLYGKLHCFETQFFPHITFSSEPPIARGNLFVSLSHPIVRWRASSRATILFHGKGPATISFDQQINPTVFTRWLHQLQGVLHANHAN